jgi:pimeloyl-ACP methyl ester carboxylesterase
MAIYVLVGGAWMGAWGWKPVVRGLRARGHEPYPLSLTGLGERVHLAQPGTDLDTHITDVVNLIQYEDLADVVLVGHSYAGLVVTGAADRLPRAISVLAYCDAAPGVDGKSLLDPQPPESQAATRRRVEEGDGWRLPFPGFPALGRFASITGLGPAEQELMTRKAAPQPFRTWTQPLRLTRRDQPRYRRAVILCEDGQRLMRSGAVGPSFGGDWRILTLDTGHWPMLSEPDALTELLAGLA